MNKIKLLALDLDGTTLTSKNTLAPAVKSALEKAIENGIIIAIAVVGVILALLVTRKRP